MSSRWKEGEGFRLNNVYRKFALLFVDTQTLNVITLLHVGTSTVAD